jgi:cellobiose-specific phosphotransferase system component IIB
MLTSIKEDNYLMAKQIGMTEEEIKESFDKSENGLSFIVMNLYNRMKEKGIIS